MNLCIKVVWEVFRVILSCMYTDKFSKKSYTCKLRKTFLWSVVGWRKLCLKFLFITKVVLKIFLYFLFKKYAKIMCINYKIQNYTLWRRKLSKNRNLCAVGDLSLRDLLTSARGLECPRSVVAERGSDFQRDRGIQFH